MYSISHYRACSTGITLLYDVQLTYICTYIAINDVNEYYIEA